MLVLDSLKAAFLADNVGGFQLFFDRNKILLRGHDCPPDSHMKCIGLVLRASHKRSVCVSNIRPAARLSIEKQEASVDKESVGSI